MVKRGNLRLAPSEIRFSQDSISCHFQDGGLVNGIVDDICEGRVDVKTIPPISVAKVNNRFYSADNRRLYVFRVLEKRGVLSHIDVRLVDHIYPDKMTTENEGVSVEVRGAKPVPHKFGAGKITRSVKRTAVFYLFAVTVSCNKASKR